MNDLEEEDQSQPMLTTSGNAGNKDSLAVMKFVSNDIDGMNELAGLEKSQNREPNNTNILKEAEHENRFTFTQIAAQDPPKKLKRVSVPNASNIPNTSDIQK